MGGAEQAYVCFGCVAIVTSMKRLCQHLRHCKEHRIPRSTPFHRYVRACSKAGKFLRDLARPLYMCPHCARYRTLESTAYKRHQVTCARAAWRIRAIEIRQRKRVDQRRSGYPLGYYRAQIKADKPLEYYQSQVMNVNASFAELTLAREIKLRRECELAGLGIWQGNNDSDANDLLLAVQKSTIDPVEQINTSRLLIWMGTSVESERTRRQSSASAPLLMFPSDKSDARKGERIDED